MTNATPDAGGAPPRATAKTRVYLHIGEPKTGTTFIQQVMWANRQRLEAHGVVLPGRSAIDHFRATQDLREVERRLDDPASPWYGEWDTLAKLACEAPGAAVISHELLCAATEEQAARAVRSLAGAEAHIVLTVRDLATLVPAEWQESVKHLSVSGWERFLRDVIDDESPHPDRRQWWFWKVHDTLEILRIWSRTLPPEHVHVVLMPPRGTSQNVLWERFAEVVGFDPSIVELGEVRSNASLGVPEVELLRRVNLALKDSVPPWFYMRHVKGVLAHGTLAARPKSERLVLPPRYNEWAAKTADELITGLRASAYDIVGDPEELRPVPTTGRGMHPSDVTSDQLLEAAVESIAGVVSAEYQRSLIERPPLKPVGGLPGLGLVILHSSPRLKHAMQALSRRYPAVARVRVRARRAAERRRSHR